MTEFDLATVLVELGHLDLILTLSAVGDCAILADHRRGVPKNANIERVVSKDFPHAPGPRVEKYTVTNVTLLYTSKYQYFD